MSQNTDFAVPQLNILAIVFLEYNLKNPVESHLVE